MQPPFKRKNSTDWQLGMLVSLQFCLEGPSQAGLGPSMSLNSGSYNTRRGHPSWQYLAVSHFQSSVQKSVKYFGHIFCLRCTYIPEWTVSTKIRSATCIDSCKRQLKIYQFANLSTLATSTHLPMSSPVMAWLRWWTYSYNQWDVRWFQHTHWNL